MSSEISISDIDIPGLPSTLTEFVQDENDTDEHRPFPQSFLLQNLLSNYPERGVQVSSTTGVGQGTRIGLVGNLVGFEP